MVENSNYFDFIARLSKFCDRENIVVGKYIKGEFEGGDIFKDFISKAGFEFTADYIIPEKDANPALPDEMLDLMRTVNSIGLTEGDKLRVQKHLSAVKLPDKIKDKFANNVFTINKKAYEKLVKNWTENNKKLNEDLFKVSSSLFFNSEIDAAAMPSTTINVTSKEHKEVIKYLPPNIKLILLHQFLTEQMKKIS